MHAREERLDQIKSTLSRIGLLSSSTRPKSSILTHFFDANASQLSHLIPFSFAFPFRPSLFGPSHNGTLCGPSSALPPPHCGHTFSSVRPIFFSYHLPIPFPSRAAVVRYRCGGAGDLFLIFFSLKVFYFYFQFIFGVRAVIAAGAGKLVVFYFMFLRGFLFNVFCFMFFFFFSGCLKEASDTAEEKGPSIHGEIDRSSNINSEFQDIGIGN